MKEDEFAENALEPMIVEKAKDYRRDNPGLGCAKLYLIIKRLFEQTGCMPGRDAFIELLRQNGLMVQIKRRRHYKTTDSNHHYHKYENLIKEIVPSRPNEIWVSDITYVETEEGVCYLSLITDTYSHMIVGWAVGPTLETVYPLEALRMALSTIDNKTAAMLIHHSDRGCQYCSGLCAGTETAQYKHQHDTKWRPAGKCRGRKDQRHSENGMALQDDRPHKRGLQEGTGTNHSVL